MASAIQSTVPENIGSHLEKVTLSLNAGTVTAIRGGSGVEAPATAAVFAGLNAAGKHLVERLVFGNRNDRSDGIVRRAPTTATVSFSNTISWAASLSTPLHEQLLPGR